MYEVYDRLTSKTVATYDDKKKARQRMDRLDKAYGGYRYNVRTIETKLAA